MSKLAQENNAGYGEVVSQCADQITKIIKRRHEFTVIASLLSHLVA